MTLNGQERSIYAYSPSQLCSQIMDFFHLDPRMTNNDHWRVNSLKQEGKSSLEILREIAKLRELSLVRIVGTKTHPIIEEWLKTEKEFREALRQSQA